MLLSCQITLACGMAACLVVPSITAWADSPAQARKDKARAAWQPVQLRAASSPRQTVDLAGDWLFKPSQELDASARPADPASEDRSWYVMDVPQFWAPPNWASFLSFGQGSYNYRFRERARCDRYGFDYMNTQSAWYRQWFNVPASMRGKRLVLRFTGVASISQVFWNGKPVGSHTGMFGPFECEVTQHVKFGKRNLLSVFVSAGKVDTETAKQAAVAVTVDVTDDMLNGLPRGLYFGGPTGGIWQPATLVVTGQDRIADVFFRPRLDGATIETTIDSRSKAPLEVRYVITDAKTGSALYRDKSPRKLHSKVLKSVISGLRPNLWSPEHPNLYVLKTQLISHGKVVDQTTTTVGFRTFEVKGNKLYLNGKPYFLRGANDPPQGIAPCDKALADEFMKLMHDGNQMVTRFHGGPFGDTWLDAADRQGVGVSMQGQWPWALIHSNPIPKPELLEIWKNDYLACVRAYRNHPSILMWTINNENYFTGGSDPDQARKAEKYRIFSDMVKATRANDPDKPVVFFSGYRRWADDYEKIIKPGGIDDGDIVDRHFYFGWYWKSLYAADIAKDFENDPVIGDMPLISQEAAVPYMDVDTGHVIRNYQVKASCWVGKHAFYDKRPNAFLETQARIAKDYAEKIRRDRSRLAGFFLFCNGLWFKDTYDAENITPFPVYWEVKKAWQPVLVSLETVNRHFMAGEKFNSNVFIVNDDPDRPSLHDLTLEWSIHGQSTDIFTSGTTSLPDCSYDSKSKAMVQFEVPSKLPSGRSDMVLELTLLQGREVISRNTYSLVCGTPEWCSIVTSSEKLIVLENDTRTSEYLASIGAQCESVKSVGWASTDTKTCVVVAPGVTRSQIGLQTGFGEFIQSGGRVLMIEPVQPGGPAKTESALAAIPGLPIDLVKSVNVWGDFVDVDPHELLDGLDPMDMAWLNAMGTDPVRVCRTSYQFPDSFPGVTKLATYVSPYEHIKPEDLPKQYSWPIFEVTAGKGRVIVSNILLADDPIARRFLKNELEYARR